MSSHNHKVKVFIVDALLDLPGDEAEWLANIRTQITMMGTLIRQWDPQMIDRIVDYFISLPHEKQKIKIKQTRKLYEK